MPLLPRSRRETWLLGGAVWVAACAGMWWTAPVVPSAEVSHLPADWLQSGVSASPDGRMLLICSPDDSESLFEKIAQWIGIPSAFESGCQDRLRVQQFDKRGANLIEFRVRFRSTISTGGLGHPPYSVKWSPDSTRIAVAPRASQPETWTIYDIPPHKSLSWFAAGAALLALPIGFVAWRRGRKLRAA